MRPWLLFAALISLIALAACAEGEKEASPTPIPTQTASPSQEEALPMPSPTQSPLPTQSTLAWGPLELRFQIDKPVYRLNQPVHMTLTVTNRSDTALTLFFRDGQRYDFTVDCEDLSPYCPPVWLWSADKAFIQALGQETLAPGQSITYEETWDQRDNDGQPVPPGKYPALGSLVGCSDEGMTNCGFGAGAVTLEIVP